MSDEAMRKPGAIAWIDLTIENAEEVRQFYEKVVGWTSQAVDMGDYQDHCMDMPSGQTVAGVCHARGENVGLPPQWMIYINVEDLDRSLELCQANGGKLLHGPRAIGDARCAVIEDPSGACAALYQPPGPKTAAEQ